ncbi:hypothetical protein EDD22DRAFT_853250 [Suillus occidentalis]|nr:hypothetical protein EDD22DRAFT_853250 [Suillus occidentalis]
MTLTASINPQGLKPHYRDGAPLEEGVVSFIFEHTLTGHDFTSRWIPNTISAPTISTRSEAWTIKSSQQPLLSRRRRCDTRPNNFKRIAAVYFMLAMTRIYKSNHDSYSKLLLNPFEFCYNRILPPIWMMLLLHASGTTNTVRVDNSIEEINTETLYMPSIARGMIGEKSLPETVFAFNTTMSWWRASEGNLTPDSDVWRAVPPERFSHRPGRQGHPYSCNSATTSSTISCTNSELQASEILLYDDLDSVQGSSESRRKGKQPETLKLDLTTYSTQERIAIDWMCKKVEMDIITIRGWESLIMEEEKSAADTYVKEIVSQANQRHTCDALATYLWHSLMEQLNHNPIHTVGMVCGWVDPCARFSKAKYTTWHSKVIKDMECISRHPVHREEFTKLLLDLHLRGMEVMKKLLERNLNDSIVYIPSSPSEMSQPLDLLESKFNCRISQSSIAPLLHLTQVKSSQSSAAPLLHFKSARPELSRVVVQSPEPYLGMGPGPSQISQTHAFAGGHPESLLTPPFADYPQPIFSNSLYRVPGIEFSSAESSDQLRMQENYYDNLRLQQPSESQQGTFDAVLFAAGSGSQLQYRSIKLWLLPL